MRLIGCVSASNRVSWVNDAKLWDESRLEFEDKSILNVKSGGYNNGNLMKCGKTSKVSKLFVV